MENLTSTKDETILMLTKLVPEDQPSPKKYLEIVKNNIIGTAPDKKPRPIEDLIYYLSVAQRTKLDPFARQIYTTWFWDSKTRSYKMTIITGIDGLRLTAQRSKLYGGQDDIIYSTKDNSADLTDQKNPLLATATVYRINPITGERMPVQATARWEEYVPTYKNKKTGKMEVGGLWKTKPFLMLGKCAEALALRKAFAQETFGLYTSEEVGEEKNQKKNEFEKLPAPNKEEKKEEPKEKLKKEISDDEIEETFDKVADEVKEERKKEPEQVVDQEAAATKMQGLISPTKK